MKKMCLIMLTALIIIICVIAFQTLRESGKEAFDGILIEKNMGREYSRDIFLQKVFETEEHDERRSSLS